MGSKGSATTKQSYSLPPEFQAAYKKSIDMATAATSQPYQAYQGQLVAGLNPTQLQGISNVNAAQGMALPAIGRGMQLTERAAQGITPELYNQFYSPYVRDVADTTFANMMESAAQQRSGLKGGAIQAGAFGGDRAGIAQAEMARQQQLGLGQTMSGIYNQGYGQAMQLAGQQAQNYGAMGQQLAGLGVGAQGSVLQGAQAQMAAGMQQQATDQAQLQAAYEQWMQRQSYPYQQAQFFANIAQGLGSGAGGTSTTSTPGPSVGSQILGGIGAIGSIFSGSDERMKENIEAVGTLNDGQTIYRYNFKGDPKTQIGLLAQEVETRKPDAVAEVSGLKMVNYKDATDQAASMGGLVTPDMQRQNFADGGVPYHPYESRGYVPEGKIGRGGQGIPDAPDAFKDEGLSKDWKEMMPLTKEQVGGLKALADKLGIALDRPEKSALGLIGSSEYDVNAPKFEDEYPTYSPRFASGGVVGRNGYFMGGEPTMEDAMNEAGLAAAEAPASASEGTSEFKYPTNPEVEAYIAQAAAKRGIDPEVAIRVWRSEGASGDPREGWQSKVINKEGKRERSFGPYQLYMEGGLGNEMEQATGLSPADPRNWRPSVDFALDKAAEGGWGPWAGAKAIGLDPRAGLAGARGAGEYSEPAGGVIAPMADTEAVMPEEPRSRFDLKKLIASEENPSIIESIMGRRLSPEARAAVMNASFAMLAGRSPFMGVNIGEAGKVGMQTYYNALQQQRELQKMEIEKTKTSAETDKIRAEIMRNWIERWRSFNFTNAADGKPSVTFDQYLKMVGVNPKMFSTSSTQTFSDSAPLPSGTGEGDNVQAMPVPEAGSFEEIPEGETSSLGEVPLPEATGQEIVEAQPVKSVTPQPSAPRQGTLDYYQQKLERANKQLAIAGDNENLLAPALAAQKFAQDGIDKIQASPEYKDQQNIVTTYGESRANLERLAKIYQNYQGGFGAEAIRDLTALADQLGVNLPPNLSNDAASFDEAYKLTVERGIADAGSNGLLKAPAAALLAESKTQPTPEMMPEARYNLIVKAIANLDRYKDLYEGWDTGPNFNGYAAKWLKDNPLPSYVEKVKQEIPPFAGMGPQPLPQSVQDALNAKFPDAKEGLTVGPGNKPQAVFKNGKWMSVQ